MNYQKESLRFRIAHFVFAVLVMIFAKGALDSLDFLPATLLALWGLAHLLFVFGLRPTNKWTRISVVSGWVMVSGVAVLVVFMKLVLNWVFLLGAGADAFLGLVSIVSLCVGLITPLLKKD